MNCEVRLHEAFIIFLRVNILKFQLQIKSNWIILDWKILAVSVITTLQDMHPS